MTRFTLTPLVPAWSTCDRHVDIPDLAENHDYYIGQELYQEVKGVEILSKRVLFGY